ncbi:hypothetical protein DPMN_115355 [Dreissena polymorpha]|uniref:EAL domain-containing protein n=1 Tax=Dreissena polymorpha TaxID=45954 RepID=A0A9D4QSK0_DREPO|nr:hypothetical protein DPMN_115355 [Dreissena polymorpha]
MSNLKEHFLLVAAIDFGTSYSGYGYSTKEDFELNPLKIKAEHLSSNDNRISDSISRWDLDLIGSEKGVFYQVSHVSPLVDVTVSEEFFRLQADW